MTSINPIFTNIASQLNSSIGLHLTLGSDSATVPLTDLVTLAGLASMATQRLPEDADASVSAAVLPVQSAPAQQTQGRSGRAGVDWSAAGKKSWETRRRNEAAKKRAGKRS